MDMLGGAVLWFKKLKQSFLSCCAFQIFLHVNAVCESPRKGVLLQAFRKLFSIFILETSSGLKLLEHREKY